LCCFCVFLQCCHRAAKQWLTSRCPYCAFGCQWVPILLLVILCHSCHVIAFHFILLHFIHLISCHFMSFHVFSCLFMSFHAILCHFKCHWTFHPLTFNKVGREGNGRGEGQICLPRPSATASLYGRRQKDMRAP
jgi:hypothetical protein